MNGSALARERAGPDRRTKRACSLQLRAGGPVQDSGTRLGARDRHKDQRHRDGDRHRQRQPGQNTWARAARSTTRCVRRQQRTIGSWCPSGPGGAEAGLERAAVHANRSPTRRGLGRRRLCFPVLGRRPDGPRAGRGARWLVENVLWGSLADRRGQPYRPYRALSSTGGVAALDLDASQLELGHQAGRELDSGGLELDERDGFAGVPTEDVQHQRLLGVLRYRIEAGG